MSKSWHIPRRSFLRGLGTVLALPALEVMEPLTRLSAATPAANSLLPKRMAFLYVPNGVNMADWRPKGNGTDFELPYILEPLQPYKQDLMVLSGLSQKNATAGADGPGDHARASATFLTGARAKKTQGADIRVGMSVDQVAASRMGQGTRFASLELGCEPGKQAGNCDSGYSCAYSSNISWRNESTPMAKEVNPKVVFERLFMTQRQGESAELRARRQKYQRSILDTVLDDAKRLQGKLGSTDRRKMEEYLNSVREIELRMERSEKFAATLPAMTVPAGVPPDYQEHIRLMADLMVLAFQSDTTRVATFVLADDGSEKPYPFIGVKEGHHSISHHQRNPEKISKIRKINRFHTEQLAYLLGRLKSIPEGEGTLLDQCMMVYGSGISDGDRHNHDDLPVILAGGGGGTLKTGRHVVYKNHTPMTNLYLSLLDRAGAPTARLGDSTGPLDQLS